MFSGADPKRDRDGNYHVTLTMSEDVASMLADLARSSGQDLDEVISKAFLLYKASADARREGKVVGIAPTADVLETEFVGL
jgi:hypothetical protein